VTLVIAHRGASVACPENTIAAFERAVAMGADMIELDVRRCGDDHLVIHHDRHLPDGRAIRTTARAALPSDIPDLASALDACAGAAVNIEIKSDETDDDAGEPGPDAVVRVTERVAAELERRGPDDRWLISSFDPGTVTACRALLSNVPTALLTTTANAADAQRAARDGHVAIHPWDPAVDESFVRTAHGLGLAVNVWTCDDPDRMRVLIGWGVDGICTNVPDIAIAVRAEVAG
jgi:glycerophosphoryl diester phosphodiesterase